MDGLQIYQRVEHAAAAASILETTIIPRVDALLSF